MESETLVHTQAATLRQDDRLSHMVTKLAVKTLEDRLAKNRGRDSEATTLARVKPKAPLHALADTVAEVKA